MKETKYYHKNSDVVAFKRKESLDGYWSEKTYNEMGNELTTKNSNGYSSERTYDEMGNKLTHKNSNGYCTERTYNERDNLLTYKNSDGYSYEYTYDERDNLLTYKNSDGLFKIKGKEVTEKKFNKFIAKQNRSCIGKKLTIDGVRDDTITGIIFEYWKSTHNLRWKSVAVDTENEFSERVNELQQMWISIAGEEKWEKVPFVD